MFRHTSEIVAASNPEDIESAGSAEVMLEIMDTDAKIKRMKLVKYVILDERGIQSNELWSVQLAHQPYRSLQDFWSLLVNQSWIHPSSQSPQ